MCFCERVKGRATEMVTSKQRCINSLERKDSLRLCLNSLVFDFCSSFTCSKIKLRVLNKTLSYPRP